MDISLIYGHFTELWTYGDTAALLEERLVTAKRARSPAGAEWWSLSSDVPLHLPLCALAVALA